METGKLTARKMLMEDLPFFKRLVIESPAWAEAELGEESLEKYIEDYHHLNGSWLVWQKEAENVALSFHLESSPSNQKPWLGTILVGHKYRKQHIGKTVINSINEELKVKGHKVIFTAVPIKHYEWMDFLTKCSFEQYKLEKDEYQNSFIIMICPLV